MGRFKKLISSCVAAVLLALQVPLPALAQESPNLIRDAEIEGLMRLYSRPIFKAAKLNPDAVKVYLIADPRINAFVAGGQRIFINTGLITRSATPNEVIGVLAHESGHIAGGHLAKMNRAMADASTEQLIGMLVGVAAIAGGIAAGNNDAARAGQGVMIGSQGLGQRSFLAYQRGMEATADESALKYLSATGQSAKGMLTLFRTLANESLASTANADPYLYSHPMPFDRIRTLEAKVKASPFYAKTDDPALLLRHNLAKAKLVGFMEPAQTVFQRYPSSDTSLPARYARAIAMFRRGDLQNAIPVIDGLTQDLPQDPYFWELKAQAYLENGKPALGLPAIRKARSLLPSNALLMVLQSQILLATDNAAQADEAISLLKLAKKQESDMPAIYKYQGQAYALKKDFAHAELALAKFAWLTGDKKMAVEKATRVQNFYKHGTPEWLEANDILTFSSKK
ncbi:MAG: M48 family metallopeptidase [Alphaproteobacteria bacterium]|nr:M48 family metallopeptidase [Alphaproteobacteria bacterium]